MNILRNLTIKGSEGREMLTDVYTEINNTKKPVVIFAHGFKGFKDWGCWDLVAKAFAENGFVFIKFNFSHNGTTVDNPLEFDDLEAFGNNNFTKELYDFGKVIDKVTNANIGISLSEFNREEIYLIGHSRGAGTAVLKANRDNRVKKIACWAGQLDFSSYFTELEEWKKKKVKYIYNGRTKQKMPLYWQFAEDYLVSYQHYTPQNVLQLTDIPFFIGYGTQDDIIKPLIISNLDKSYTSKVSVFIENANHVFNGYHPYDKLFLPAELNDLVKETVKFFRL